MRALIPPALILASAFCWLAGGCSRSDDPTPRRGIDLLLAVDSVAVEARSAGGGSGAGWSPGLVEVWRGSFAQAHVVPAERLVHLAPRLPSELAGSGAALLVAPAEPQREYALRLDGRAAVESRFAALALELAAVAEPGDLDRLVEAHAEAGSTVWQLDVAAEGLGAEARFRTGESTRAILLVAIVPDPPRGLARLRLSRVAPSASLWNRRGEERDRTSVRRVEAMFDHRPALLVPAPGAARISVETPPGRFLFSCSVSGLDEELTPALAVTARLESKGAVAREMTLSLPAGRSRWVPLEGEVELPGGPVEVSFEVGVAGPDAGRIASGAAVANPRLDPASEDAREALPDIVLVSLDTVRRDRLGVYGARPDPTLNLSAFAKTAVVFEQCVAPGAYTLSSHASLFTGHEVDRHGVIGPGKRLDPSASATLAVALRDLGYRTAAFTGGGYVDPAFGFAAGFERYSTYDPARDPAFARPAASAVFRREEGRLARARDPRAEMIRFLSEPSGPPRFVFVHTYAAHNYAAPDADLVAAGLDPAEVRPWIRDRTLMEFSREAAGFEGADRERLKKLYDASIRVADRLLGDVLRAIDASGRARRTVVVVTSDHGEELFEHGRFGHGYSVYREMVEVPLLIRAPGMTPKRIGGIVSLVDVAPTLLELAGAKVRPDAHDGRSLVALIGGERVGDRVALSRADDSSRGTTLRALTGTRWKWIQDGADGVLYDRTRDPGEQAAATLAHPDVARSMARALSARVEALSSMRGGSGAFELSEDVRRTLRELGYLDG